MVYRKLKNGIHAVGFTYQGRFIACSSAFDAREAKALVKALHAVMELFHKTSGGWVTMGPEGKEMPRGSTAKRMKKERALMPARRLRRHLLKRGKGTNGNAA
jgi:hypothetical protein